MLGHCLVGSHRVTDEFFTEHTFCCLRLDSKWEQTEQVWTHCPYVSFGPSVANATFLLCPFKVVTLLISSCFNKIDVK